MKNTTFVVYSNLEEAFVTTKRNEAKFILNMMSWGYNMDKDNGDFDREVICNNDHCVRITKPRGFYID